MNVYKIMVEAISIAVLAASSIVSILAVGLFARGVWEAFLLGYTLFGYLP